MGIQSPKAIKEYGQDLGLHPVGTGPFSFVSYQAGQNLVVKRNDAYNWNPPATKFTGPPDIAQITFQIVTSPQARVSQFQTGQSDVIQDVPGVFWNALAQDEPLHRDPGADHRHGHLRADQRRELADQRHRGAPRDRIRGRQEGRRAARRCRRLSGQQHAAGQGHDRL